MQVDFVEARHEHGQPNFDFTVAVGRQQFGSVAKTAPNTVASVLSWLADLRHLKVVIQSDGGPASEVVMCMVKSQRCV